jgi:hypothetical protein
MRIDHVSRAEKAWPLLVRRANENGPVYTYGELCAELGLHPRSAGWLLGVIQSYCKRNKLPPLQALVVNKKTKLPGTGYVGSPRSRAAHNRAVSMVFKAKWSLSPPKLSPIPTFKRDTKVRRPSTSH